MFGRLYSALAPRKQWLVGVYLLFVLASVACFFTIEQQEHIQALLPDSGQTTVQRDFAWLQKAPLARNVLIDLQAEPSVSDVELSRVSDQLVAALQQAEAGAITQAFNAPPLQVSAQFFGGLTAALPALATETDLQQIDARLESATLRQRLRQIKEQLMTPEGWWSKQQLREDPLQLWQITASHLRRLNPLGDNGASPSGFVSADGRHRLVVVETPIEIGDLAGSRRLVATLNHALAAVVPDEVNVSMISGHLYTLANADTVQRDLRVVLGVASVAIALIFVLLLRSRRALWIFMLPASVLGFAAMAVKLFFPSVSGITIGFGAVLLGITVDFTLHVFFAVRDNPSVPRALETLTRPLVGGAMTSFLAFSVLLCSALPGQRQLAVFSMTAIVLALLLALIVMPHLSGGCARLMAQPRRGERRVAPVWGVVWLLLLLGAVGGIGRITFDGDLRRLSVVTPGLDQAERQLQQVWGNMRGQALLFAVAPDRQQALQINDRLFKSMTDDGVPLVSMAGILPSVAQQQENRLRWQQFWNERQEQLLELSQLAQEQGFSSTAFTPFFSSLEQPGVTIDDQFWQQLGLAPLLEGLVIDNLQPGQVAVLSLVDEGLLTEVRRRQVEAAGAVVVAQGAFRRQLSALVSHDFRQFIVSAALVVCAVLVVWYRRPAMVFMALLPVISGLVVMFGCMGWAGLSFNLFNVIATILVIGLGVDYGIFMLSRCQGHGGRHTDRAVLVSALTTLAGFGSLALARHPSMSSIGVTVLFGISGAVFTALMIVPLVYRRLYRDGRRS